MKSLAGKVALITGAGTGIGRSTAGRIAQQGAIAVVNYNKSRGEAESALNEIKTLGGQGIIYQADVSNDSQVKEMVNSIVKEYGHLDILVNNAGTTHFVDYDDLDGMSEEYWDRILAVNLKGTFFCCRAAAPHLKKQKGCIVNVASIAGVVGLGSSIAYSASKAAIINLTKSLARVLAPEVRVNSVSPGIVMTRWVAGQQEHIERLSSTTPLKRACEPEDVSEVILSLVNSAEMITGQNIIVDGGMYIGT